MSDNKTSTQVTVYIDGIAYQVNKENNLLAGVLSQKLNLPYFCWHPSMGSVGACRQCAVTQFQDENDTRGRLIMACTTPVSDGMRISIKDPQASKFREQVIGAMMTNHPHDCPVCAEGGECHLQDMTVMTGHSARDYQGSKRTFNNQYLGELVGHEMNRCITCYRCTRFYNDYAGGEDFGVYGSKNQVYFGRQSDGALESEFAGNLVEVCPTGVFTNKAFSQHYSRKWDLQSAPSVCTHCSVGCNLSIGERYGSVRRVMNRYNHDLNGYFLCDRGRYGIGFVNGEQRIRTTKGIDQQSPLKLTNLDVAKRLSHYRLKRFIGIGSARASLEANFYLKNIVGAESFSLGYNNNEMRVASQHLALLNQDTPPSLHDIEASDFILIVGEDITQTAARMALSVRQALRNAANEKAANIGIPSWQDSAVRTIGGKLLSPLFSLHTTTTKLDGVAEKTLLGGTQDIEKSVQVLTQLIAHHDVKQAQAWLDEQSALTVEQRAIIFATYKALVIAKKPLIISGTSLQSANLIHEISLLNSAINQQAQLENSQVIMVPPACNSVGLLSLMDEKSLSVEQVLAKLDIDDSSAKDGKVEKVKYQGVVLLEQELASMTSGQIQQLRTLSETIIVLDHSQSQLAELADIVMPVSAVSEGDGHYVNYQKRIQAFAQVHAPVLPIQDSWRWLDALANTLGIYVATEQQEENVTANAKHVDKSQSCQSLQQLHHFFGENWQSWPNLNLDLATGKAIARMSHRASGRTAQMANISIHESKTTQKNDDNYRFSMEGAAPSNSENMPFTWAPGWNSNQSISQFQQEISGELIHCKNANYVAMPFNAELHRVWPLTAATSFNANDLTYYQQESLYLSEYQAAFTPEFLMLSPVQKVYLSSAYAKALTVESGQWLNVSANKAGENSANIIAQLHCIDTMPDNVAFGNFALSNRPNVSDEHGSDAISLTFTAASDKEITQYISRHNSEIAAAKTSKANVLEQLKSGDQNIPIRLVSGGLNDD
jgi:NADH-quinone oxidoreductase subunit G